MFVIALVVAFVLLSLVADKGATGERIVTGTVTEWRPAEYLAVANSHSGPFRVSLRKTLYERDTHDMHSGVRVTVWYRNVGERNLVADRVRVLNAATR